MPISRSMTHARPVAHLYRQVLRAIPTTIVKFDLDMTETQVRDKMRELFRRHTKLDGRGKPVPLPAPVLDAMLRRGEEDLRETTELWKQKTHLQRLLMGM